MAKYVYLFKEGNANMRNTLGGKGANLAEMTNIGMPVPQGFTVTTEACTRYYEDGRKVAPEIEEQIFKALAETEKIAGKKFGDLENPFLVSVRSGSRASMPGMMDTILNLGLNDVAVEGLAKLTDNPRFAYDSYRRFIEMFAGVVMEVERKYFAAELDAVKEEKGVTGDTDLTADDMKEVARRFKEVYKKHKGEDFPQDPKVQLMESIKAVFRSWDNPRAVYYRRMNDIPGDWGTAVNVQAMVFGNMGDSSATGVAFTRDPATGENVFYGEYLQNAQGEDVVAGIRTPMPINIQGKHDDSQLSLEEVMNDQYKQLVDVYQTLEKHYRDMQDIEFTIQEGNLWMLQTRTGKRTAAAAVKTAVDMVDEGLITKEEAVLRVDPEQIDQLLHPQIDPHAEKQIIGKGLPASPGAAVGRVVFSADHEAAKAAGRWQGRGAGARGNHPGGHRGHGPVPRHPDRPGRHDQPRRRGRPRHGPAGRGGLPRHLLADEEKKLMTTKDGQVFHEGDAISLDGSTGKIYKGLVPTGGGHRHRRLCHPDDLGRTRPEG